MSDEHGEWRTPGAPGGGPASLAPGSRIAAGSRVAPGAPHRTAPARPTGGSVLPAAPGRGSLSGAAAVTSVLVVSLLTAVIDAIAGSGVSTLFAVCFFLVGVAAALLVRRASGRKVVVAVPLVYLLCCIVAGAINVSQGSGSWLSRELVEVITNLVTEAPALLLTTGVCLLVVFLRRVVEQARAVSHRSAGRRAAPRRP